MSYQIAKICYQTNSNKKRLIRPTYTKIFDIRTKLQLLIPLHFSYPVCASEMDDAVEGLVYGNEPLYYRIR